MAGRVTIQDIADALGVSRNTVSKAINNTGILADATREKILQKAVEMGYKQFSYYSLVPESKNANIPLIQPTEYLQTESTSEGTPASASSVYPDIPHTISLFTGALLGNSHFSSTMLDKMQRELSYQGYSITIHRVTPEDIQHMTLPNSFSAKITAAIICIEIFDQAYSEMLCDLGLPILFIDAPAPDLKKSLKSDLLLMDNRSEIYSFIHEMVRRGKTNIGFIGEYMHCTSFFERFMSYQEALLMLDLPYKKEFCILKHTVSEGKLSSEKYQEYIQECIRNMKTLPDVFICANDFVAIDTLQVFRKMGISVPDDVLLCGFDDSPESRIVTPPLTTIHIHSQVMGFSAVQLLISRIKNPSLNYRTVHAETSLIYRDSTGDADQS